MTGGGGREEGVASKGSLFVAGGHKRFRSGLGTCDPA